MAQTGLTVPSTQMRGYLNGLITVLIFLCGYFAVHVLLNLNRPYWGDEEHFVATIRQFGQGITLDLIKHYNEMSTPLPFVMYAVWGRIFGFETPTLRIFSIVLAVFTFISLYHLLFSTLNEAALAALTVVFLALNPYMIAFSIFAFTDMAAMLFLVISCLAIRDENPVLLAFSLAAGLLSRQYLAFLVAAAGAYHLIRLREGRSRGAISMLVADLASMLPLLALFWIWQGPNPDNQVKQLYAGETLQFHPNSFTLYIILLFVYLLPVVLLAGRAIFTGLKTLVVAAAAALLYWQFPVQPSSASLEVNVSTVGVFHRAMRLVLGPQIEHLIFFVCFYLGMTIALALIKDIYTRLRSKDHSFPLFLGLSILSFLAIMPFSYLGWEKYFLPAIPIAAMWIESIIRRAPTDRPALLANL